MRLAFVGWLGWLDIAVPSLLFARGFVGCTCLCWIVRETECHDDTINVRLERTCFGCLQESASRCRTGLDISRKHLPKHCQMVPSVPAMEISMLLPLRFLLSAVIPGLPPARPYLRYLLDRSPFPFQLCSSCPLRFVPTRLNSAILANILRPNRFTRHAPVHLPTTFHHVQVVCTILLTRGIPSANSLGVYIRA